MDVRWTRWESSGQRSRSSTADIIVFTEPGDMVLLGARSLEGLNLHIDVVHKAWMLVRSLPPHRALARLREGAGQPPGTAIADLGEDLGIRSA